MANPNPNPNPIGRFASKSNGRIPLTLTLKPNPRVIRGHTGPSRPFAALKFGYIAVSAERGQLS